MTFNRTEFPGVFILEPKVWGDERGYFFEAYNHKNAKEAGLDVQFVQDNQAKSSFGVLRGLHYQVAPFAQAKLVRVIKGEVLDVIVDIRAESPTFGKWMSIRLSAENKKQLFVPRGFAHGYVVLSESAEFFYKCDNYYSKAHEAGLRFDDPQLNIDWEIDLSQVTINERDQSWADFGQHKTIELA